MPLPRLTEPLVRRGDDLVPVSWDEALVHVTDALAANRARYGPNAFGMFSCSKATNETNFLA